VKKLPALFTVVFSVFFVVVGLASAGIVRRSNSGNEPKRTNAAPPPQYEPQSTQPPDGKWSGTDSYEQKTKEKEQGKSEEPKKGQGEETRRTEKRKTYDNFIDRNGNGIDDRYEKKTRGTEESGSKKKKKPGE
jgi:hypothetical protein